MIQTTCAVCGSQKNYQVLYSANFSAEDLNKEIFSARRLPDGSHYQIVKCTNDGLIRSNPIFEPSKITKLYQDSKFTYEQETENLETTYLIALQPILKKIRKDDNILEIGCGNGFILKKLYQMGFKKCFGIEPSYEAASKADEKIKPNIIVDILKPGILNNKKFKFIFFFQTLDHIPDPGKFLNQCYKLLVKSGYILAFNHNVESLSSKLLGEKSPIIDIEHTFLYSPDTIKKLFEKYNFQPINIYSPVNTISLKHLIWLLPLPKLIKRGLLLSTPPSINLRLKLGNLCIIARKLERTFHEN